MVALAGNLDFTGSRFLASLTAEFFARLRHAATWKVGTLCLLGCGHRLSP
jgi:hypothetical protein